MKLPYEQNLDYDIWSKKLIRISWYFALLLIVIELLIFAGWIYMDDLDDVFAYFQRYVLGPVVGSVIIVGIVQGVSGWLLENKKYAAQSFLYLTGIALVCTVIAWTHEDVLVIQAIFCFPIFLSIIYVDKTTLRYIFILSLALYIAFSLIEATQIDFPNALTNIGLMIASFMISNMILRRQTSLVQNILAAHEQTRLDQFTGLYNHAAFYEELDDFILRFNRTGKHFCLIIMDIDNFKTVNDTYGHDVGDDVILAFATVIKEKASDGDLAFRYGGEEFTILTRKTLDESFCLAEDLRCTFKNTTKNVQPYLNLTITASAGVTRYDSYRFGGRREFFAAADEALYEAKRNGKDRSVIWTERMRPENRF